MPKKESGFWREISKNTRNLILRLKEYIKNKAIRKKNTLVQVKHSKGSENMIK